MVAHAQAVYKTNRSRLVTASARLKWKKASRSATRACCARNIWSRLRDRRPAGSVSAAPAGESNKAGPCSEGIVTFSATARS